MQRDFQRYEKWEAISKERQLREFERTKELGEIRKNAQFQFDKSSLLSYGKCSKFKKDVSFIPNVCQIETQDCFLHRRDGK